MGPKGRVSEERQGRSKGTFFLVLAFLVFLGNFKLVRDFLGFANVGKKKN